MMIEWVYGESGMGKTTLARKLVAQTPHAVLLDGDDLRQVWPDLGYGRADRRRQNLRVAKLARLLDMQGFNVIVATILPGRKLKAEVGKITGCRFIHIKGERDKKTW